MRTAQILHLPSTTMMKTLHNIDDLILESSTSEAHVSLENCEDDTVILSQDFLHSKDSRTLDQLPGCHSVL